LNNNYDTMTKEQLIEECFRKDTTIDTYKKLFEYNGASILTKRDIMKLFHCENDKALKILKVMYQMGYGNKIGKEYYVSKNSQEDFIKDMKGKEVII